MSYISSYNSYAVIQPIEDLADCFTIHQVESSLDVEVVSGNYVLADASFSKSFVQFYSLQSITFETYEESDTSLEALGLPMGSYVNIWLRRGTETSGSDPTFDLVASSMYKGWRRTTRVGKARGMQLMFEGGTYTHNATPNDELNTYLGVELLE